MMLMCWSDCLNCETRSAQIPLIFEPNKRNLRLMNYIWQHPDWPNFTYQTDGLSQQLYQYALDAGRLSGGLEQLHQNDQYETFIDLMVSEALNSSLIEGEKLDREDVRSSIKNYLGLTHPPKRVADPRAEGIAALMVEIRNTFSKPLTKEALFRWHQMVMSGHENRILGGKINVGKWRTSEEPMQIVSGPIGYEKVYFEAPPSSKVPDEMNAFIQWFNQTNPQVERTLSGPVRAAVAHLWFETIHPFDDGNGRIGRALAEIALAQDLGAPPLSSLSTAIEKNKNDYYDALHFASQPSLNITEWVNWFVTTVKKSQDSTVESIQFILQKSRFWTSHSNTPINDRQQKVLRKWFEAWHDGFEFGMSAKKYMSIAACSKATATRDLTELVKHECIKRLPGKGKNIRYQLNLDK